METKFIAIAPNDGFGFLLIEGKILLLRPPYTRTNISEVTDQMVEKAINSYGFEPCNAAIKDISEAVKFLKEQYVQSKEKQGMELPSPKKLKQLLKYAPDEVLLGYLDKAKDQLIPSGELDAALEIATLFIELDRSPEIVRMSANVLRECCRKRKVMQDLQMMAVEQGEDWERRFPDAARMHPVEYLLNYQQAVHRRGHLLPLT